VFEPPPPAVYLRRLIFTKKPLMKKYLYGLTARLLLPALLATATLVATSCKKDDDTTTTTQDYSAADDAAIQKYIADNNITNARKQPSGLYYVPVTTNPNGLQATAGRTVTVSYAGTLLNGSAFDAGSYTFPLGARQVIAGWDEGIALMRLNEQGILLIPSKLAYGSQSPSPKIPANSVLRFDVTLTRIQ
jgi:FKBP-type peptidyl-prolyl cis-trans isomerase